MHFTFEPKTFIESLIEHVNEFAVTTKEAFHKFALINDVSSGET
jgi:hypothetical protein